MNLSSKTAIITGASSGLGAEFSKKLTQKGTTVYGLARSDNKLKNLQTQLGDLFHPVKMDITDHKAISDWIQKIFTQGRKPDILINNAGLGIFGNVEDLPRQDWETMIDTNLSGIFYITRNVVPLMKRNEQVCHIINIASIAGKIGNPQISGYNATKFGVRGFSESLFKELRYDGIKVTCFYPGSISTSFFDNAEEMDTHPNMMTPRDISKTLIDVLETSENYLINEVVMRPLNPKPPEKK